MKLLFFRNSLRVPVAIAIATLVSTPVQAASNLKTLVKSCFVLHDPSGKYDISPEWEEPAKVMGGLPILPDLTKRIKDVITADHGNCEQMVDYDAGQAHTQHTTELVPLVYVGNRQQRLLEKGGKLADIAPTMLALMDVEQPAEMTGINLLQND